MAVAEHVEFWQPMRGRREPGVVPTEQIGVSEPEPFIWPVQHAVGRRVRHHHVDPVWNRVPHRLDGIGADREGVGALEDPAIHCVGRAEEGEGATEPVGEGQGRIEEDVDRGSDALKIGEHCFSRIRAVVKVDLVVAKAEDVVPGGNAGEPAEKVERVALRRGDGIDEEIAAVDEDVDHIVAGFRWS